MTFEYKSMFIRAFRKLESTEKEKVNTSVDALLEYLDKKIPLPAGLGLKKLKEDFWEIRVGLKTRVVFEFSDRIIFWLVGTHDDIVRFISGK